MYMYFERGFRRSLTSCYRNAQCKHIHVLTIEVEDGMTSSFEALAFLTAFWSLIVFQSYFSAHGKQRKIRIQMHFLRTNLRAL